MSDPAVLLEITGVEKTHGGLRPLRLTSLTVSEGDRVVLSGFDAGAAEAFMHLVTGAMLPDRGEVIVAGRNTRDVETDTEWLASLDGLGLVTDRAVLLDAMSVAANLALPFTLAIDEIPDAVRAKVEAIAGEVGLDVSRLAQQAATQSAAERLLMHLARALAPDPRLLLLEHPTARIDPDAAEAFGQAVRRISEARRLAVVALSNDDRFSRALGARRLTLTPASGVLGEAGFWGALLSRANVGAKRPK